MSILIVAFRTRMSANLDFIIYPLSLSLCKIVKSGAMNFTGRLYYNKILLGRQVIASFKYCLSYVRYNRRIT